MATRGHAHHGAATAAAFDLRRAGILALAFALVSTLLGGLVGDGATAPRDRLLVTARDSVAAAIEAIAGHGGRLLEVVEPFGVLVADVPTSAVEGLASDPATLSVTPDVSMTVQSADTTSVARATIDAPVDPNAGAGIGIVFVDTGIADHPDLAGRVVGRYDLTSDPGQDPHGHGTFLAGIAAGSGASSAGIHAGVAPAAHLVSVRVSQADGATTLSQVLHGLAVADAARELHDAPVVVLALSGPAGTAPDPLMIVLEMLWARGSTVVVAAGNDGAAAGTVGSPGVDPYLLTVGALDDGGTADTSDDTVPTWSSRGPTPYGHAKPDLVAPGVSVIGLRNPGSTIDLASPDARVGDQYFRGSGTSMAAAWTAGAAAAVLAADPTLTPDEVKGRLMASATSVAGAGPNDAGAGTLDVQSALQSTAGPANTELAPLPAPRNSHAARRAVAPGQLRRTAAGQHIPAGWTWTGWTWTGWTWTGWTWTDRDWTGWTWTDQDWAGWTWTDQDWAGWTWTGSSWTGWSWTGWSWTARDWGA